MIQIYPAASRHAEDHGWLKSHFSFSFAEYFDRNNMHFSALRVFNDDIIAGGKGFGMHPHQEMEIVSIVLKGELEHKDSMGNVARTSFGEIQRMSAGTGIYHSEFNPLPDQETHLLQLWFLPAIKGLEPSYQHTTFDQEKLVNQLLPVVSQQSSEQVAHIHQDLTLYLSRLEKKQSIRFTQEEGRSIYIFVIEGELMLNGEHSLQRRDAARITEETELDISASTEALWMLIDLP